MFLLKEVYREKGDEQEKRREKLYESSRGEGKSERKEVLID